MNNIILHLSLIEGIGPAAVARIIAQLGVENLDQIYQFSLGDAMHQLGFSQKTAQKLVDGLASQRLLEQELLLIQKHKISWVTCADPSYPELLKTIHMPPSVLYWRGTLPDQNSIAIVGSREANAYGRMAIDRLVPDLIAAGWTIVSGGALGADTMAHQKALDEGGKTVAVWGSGLLFPYPPQNEHLFAEIVEQGGAVVSIFPMLFEPLPEHFPARNRVIAGLSRGCIVIQAAAKSGAKITAEYCLSQSREVFAVPGPIDDYLSVGCHDLLAQGAKLVSKTADVLVEFGYSLPEQTIIAPTVGASKRPVVVASQEKIMADPIEAAIVNACKSPCSVDELLEATGLPLVQMSKLLFDLQLKRVLTQNMAGLWERQ